MPYFINGEYMEIKCTSYAYSQEWDDLLKYLLDNYKSIEIKQNTVVFRVPIGSYFFGALTKYKTYSVWIENRSSAFGFLYTVNGNESGVRNAASTETLARLSNLISIGKTNPYEIPLKENK